MSSPIGFLGEWTEEYVVIVYFQTISPSHLVLIPCSTRACAKNLKVLPYFTVLVDVSVELGMQNPHFQSLLIVIVSFAIYIAEFSVDHGLVGWLLMIFFSTGFTCICTVWP